MIVHRMPQTTVIFGQGDIMQVGFTADNLDGNLCARWGLTQLDEAVPVGTSVHKEVKDDWSDVPVIFAFESIDSLDIVIDGLQKLRRLWAERIERESEEPT